VSQVAITENHLVFALVAVNSVISRTILLNETVLIITLHCNIYLALKYLEKLCFFLFEQHLLDENVSINCVTVCATRGYTSAANRWGSGSRCIRRNTIKYTKLMNWIPDNSRLSPTENPKSEHVHSNRPIHTGTSDTTQTGPSCRV